METPATGRTASRSQLQVPSSNSIPKSRIKEETDQEIISKSKRNRSEQDRCCLIDITNDSPIVGLVMGDVNTPLSSLTKKKSLKPNRSPESGEALLRGQVKNFLQKVEEEAEYPQAATTRNHLVFHVHGVDSPSPVALLAPTPANTPLVSDSASSVDPLSVPCPCAGEHLIRQVVRGGGKDEHIEQEEAESVKCLATLPMLDFFQKSESSECSSVLTSQDGEAETEDTTQSDTDEEEDEVDASMWSTQANASTLGEDADEAEVDAGGEVEVVEGLCDRLEGMNVRDDRVRMRHTRFLYDSDDELVGGVHEPGCSPGVTRLVGLPTPKGKHTRFPLDD